MKIRDRIKEFRRVPASELKRNPRNWRTHPIAQADALKGLFAEVGIADAPIVRESDDGFELIDGHLRAETLGSELVPVLVLDVTREEADKLLATLDPLAAMASRDDERLVELLREIETDSEGVRALLDELRNEAGAVGSQANPPEDFPEYGEGIATEYRCPKCGYKWSGKPK